MARLIDKGTREYTCALIMMFFGSLAAFGAEYCLQPVIPILAQDFNLTPTSKLIHVFWYNRYGFFNVVDS